MFISKKRLHIHINKCEQFLLTQPKKRIFCKICYRTFQTEKSLNNHNKLQHKKGMTKKENLEMVIKKISRKQMQRPIRIKFKSKRYPTSTYLAYPELYYDD